MLVRLLELFNREAGDLGHHVVNGGLKAGGRFPRDVVAQFVQRVEMCIRDRYEGSCMYDNIGAPYVE